MPALLSLLAEDARFTMPPLPTWFDGRADVVSRRWSCRWEGRWRSRWSRHRADGHARGRGPSRCRRTQSCGASQAGRTGRVAVDRRCR
ncbi:hypothetical protein [Jiangella rhizosphaerae]|uniref:hypothetical protein n=1 Tax=Jiangella rhizosphaerae TaxID=2293569 RepID=UPI0018F30294